MDSFTNEAKFDATFMDLGHADTDPGAPALRPQLSSIATPEPEPEGALTYTNSRLRRVMDPTPLLLNERVTIGELARSMSACGGDLAVLVNQHQHVLGLCSASDLLHAMMTLGIGEWDSALAAKIAMLAPPVLPANARLDDARELLTHLRCPAVVVVDSNRVVIGLVRARDLLNALHPNAHGSCQ